jgi:cation:H+ antiporter
LPEAMIGLLTALAADGPNISSALYALIRGAHDVGVGVLVGSNAFQLAGMIGLSGLLAGAVILPRESLALEGVAAVAITLIAGAVLLDWLAPLAGVALGVAVAIPYLVVVIGGSEVLAHSRGRAPHLVGRLARVLDQRPRPQRSKPRPSEPAHRLLALIVLDVGLILVSSVGMVEAALALGGRLHISSSVLGVLVLAPLTSIPNAITGVRLGLAGRGAALVSETFNSNSINLGVGVLVPALFASLGVLTISAKLQLAWLIGMTVVCITLLASSRGMRRIGASAVLVLYLGFIAIEVLS